MVRAARGVISPHLLLIRIPKTTRPRLSAERATPTKSICGRWAARGAVTAAPHAQNKTTPATGPPGKPQAQAVVGGAKPPDRGPRRHAHRRDRADQRVGEGPVTALVVRGGERGDRGDHHDRPDA